MAQHAKDKDVTYDSQRRRIEKLMENPDKLIELPDTSMSIGKKYEPPDFVRNVMGSSAGAGSGEFHVYRHLRRKEMTRLKEMEESAVVDELNQEYKSKLDAIKREAELRSLKKKQKREKKRERMKQKRSKKKNNDTDVANRESHQSNNSSDSNGDIQQFVSSSKHELQQNERKN